MQIFMLAPTISSFGLNRPNSVGGFHFTIIKSCSVWFSINLKQKIGYRGLFLFLQYGLLSAYFPTIFCNSYLRARAEQPSIRASLYL